MHTVVVTYHTNNCAHLLLILVYCIYTPLAEGVLSHYRHVSDLVCYTHSFFSVYTSIGTSHHEGNMIKLYLRIKRYCKVLAVQPLCCVTAYLSRV